MLEGRVPYTRRFSQRNVDAKNEKKKGEAFHHRGTEIPEEESECRVPNTMELPRRSDARAVGRHRNPATPYGDFSLAIAPGLG